MDIWSDFAKNGIDCGPVEEEDLRCPDFDPIIARPQLTKECKFCKNNGEEEAVYRSHHFKSSRGVTLCPKLRSYTCPICGANGDRAHTLKYCPKKKILTEEDIRRIEWRRRVPKRSLRLPVYAL